MAKKVHLTLACGDYESVRALIDGKQQIYRATASLEPEF
jgi:hypothetical protein